MSKKFQSEHDGNLASSDSGIKQGLLKFTFGQMLIIWLNIGLIMFLAWGVGFYVGRDYGAKHALENQKRVDIRIPLVRPVMPASLEQEIKAVKDEVQYNLTPPANAGDSAGYVPPPAGLPPPQESATVGVPLAVGASSSVAPVQQVSEEQDVKISSSRIADVIASSSRKRSSSKAVSSAWFQPPAQQASVAGGTSGYKWYIQAATLVSKADAEDIIKRSKADGKLMKIETSMRGTNKLYRILVGPFDSKEEAEAKKEELKKNRGLAKDMYVSRFDGQ